MQSLPTMEGPVTFVAPELAEEVLMDVRSISGVQTHRATYIICTVDVMFYVTRQALTRNRALAYTVHKLQSPKRFVFETS